MKRLKAEVKTGIQANLLIERSVSQAAIVLEFTCLKMPSRESSFCSFWKWVMFVFLSSIQVNWQKRAYFQTNLRSVEVSIPQILDIPLFVI